MASVGDELVLTPSKMTNSRFDDVKLDASGNALQPQASVDVAPALKDSAARIHRYAVLDTYRFLAASGVVFYHFENHFQTFLSISTNYLERFQNFVDFFFVLSGFVLMHSYGYRLSNWHNYRDFLRKKVCKTLSASLGHAHFDVCPRARRHRFASAGKAPILLRFFIGSRSPAPHSGMGSQ